MIMVSVSRCCLYNGKGKWLLAPAWTLDGWSVTKESSAFGTLKISDQFKITHSDREMPSVKRWEL